MIEVQNPVVHLPARCSLFTFLSPPPGEFPSQDSYVKGSVMSFSTTLISFFLSAFTAQCALHSHSLHLSAGPKTQHGKEPGVL